MNKIQMLEARRESLMTAIGDGIMDSKTKTEDVIKMVREAKNIGLKMKRVQDALAVLEEFETEDADVEVEA